jgi:hypothetical protein
VQFDATHTGVGFAETALELFIGKGIPKSKAALNSPTLIFIREV